MEISNWKANHLATSQECILERGGGFGLILTEDFSMVARFSIAGHKVRATSVA